MRWNLSWCDHQMNFQHELVSIWPIYRQQSREKKSIFVLWLLFLNLFCLFFTLARWFIVTFLLLFTATVRKGAVICALKSGKQITMGICFQYVLTDSHSIIVICTAVVVYLFFGAYLHIHTHIHNTQYVYFSLYRCTLYVCWVCLRIWQMYLSQNRAADSGNIVGIWKMWIIHSKRSSYTYCTVYT